MILGCPLFFIKLEFVMKLRVFMYTVCQQPSSILQNDRLRLANNWNRRACLVIKPAFWCLHLNDDCFIYDFAVLTWHQARQKSFSHRKLRCHKQMRVKFHIIQKKLSQFVSLVKKTQFLKSHGRFSCWFCTFFTAYLQSCWVYLFLWLNIWIKTFRLG